MLAKQRMAIDDFALQSAEGVKLTDNQC